MYICSYIYASVHTHVFACISIKVQTYSHYFIDLLRIFKFLQRRKRQLVCNKYTQKIIFNDHIIRWNQIIRWRFFFWISCIFISVRLRIWIFKTCNKCVFLCFKYLSCSYFLPPNLLTKFPVLISRNMKLL